MSIKFCDEIFSTTDYFLISHNLGLFTTDEFNEVISDIKMNHGDNCQIVLISEHGYFTTYYCFYKAVSELNLDISNVTSMSPLLTDYEITKISDHFNMPKITSYSNHCWEETVRKAVSSLPLNDISKKCHNEGKKYFSLNNKIFKDKNIDNNDWCRHHIVKMLASNGLLNDGYVSYNNINLGLDNKEYSQDVLVKKTIDFLSHREETKDQLELMISQKDHLMFRSLVIDEEALQIRSDWWNNHASKDYAFNPGQGWKIEKNGNLTLSLTFSDMVPLYENTYFGLVTEHNVSNYNLYNIRMDNILTEKTFRSIAFKHPFILCGTTGLLKCLRNLGYKTFDGIIDESYDDEEDDSIRLTKIVNEVKRLCQLSDTELKEFLDQTKDICQYNYNHLCNRKLSWSKIP